MSDSGDAGTMAASTETGIDRWVRPEIAALSAYQVADATGMIKLDAMENPYSWPEDLTEAWLERLRGAALNRYPDPQARQLKSRLQATMGIPEQAGVLLGNGSDELIQMIALTVGLPGRVVLSVEPGFVMYRLIAAVAGMTYVGVDLRSDDFSLDLAAVVTAMRKYEPAVVFLACPNNPTGNLFDPESIQEVIAQAPGLVVIDEAYAPFTDFSFMPRAGAHANVLVMRTVSKMGLAGLRLGYLAGPRSWITQIDKARLPYNINVMTQISADFALANLSEFESQTERIRMQRARLQEALRAVGSLTVFPSEANFILFRTRPGQADRIHAELKKRGILIKNLSQSAGVLRDCLRVTVGLPEENDAFVDALRHMGLGHAD